MATKLRILAYLHLYLPNHNAGAELMIHQMLKDLRTKGHEVRVVCGSPAIPVYEGIRLYDFKHDSEVSLLIRWSDIMITHLDFTKRAIKLSLMYGKPLVHIIHNDTQVEVQGINAKNSKLLIANSQWINDSIPNINVKKVICYPPIKVADYQVNTSREAITLINLIEKKGSTIFYQLAEMFPERKFIGVIGGYGKQVIKELPNVEIVEHNPNIKKVYERTRILIVPSIYESWGRVGMESGASGIPVIANATEGLKESIGYGGLFASSVEEYAEIIKKLDDEQFYRESSEYILNRVKEVEKKYLEMIDLVEQELLLLVK